MMAASRNANGVLPISASTASKKANTSSPASATSQRQGIPRLRLIVRRLPPGFTQAEFEDTLGDDWWMGAGRVDWFAYKNGKISKE